MIRANPSTDPFAPEAARRWERVPQWAQEKILENVYCGQCVAPVPIVLETAEMEGEDLILRGKCKTCGETVCRVVESESQR